MGLNRLFAGYQTITRPRYRRIGGLHTDLQFSKGRSTYHFPDRKPPGRSYRPPHPRNAHSPGSSPIQRVTALATAIAWYARWFSERSGVKVQVEVADDLGRLPPELEKLSM